MEFSNDLITNVVFNLSHIDFVGFASNNMESEPVNAIEHATKKTSYFIKIIEGNNVQHGNHTTTT
jgi:hypothetical protein